MYAYRLFAMIALLIVTAVGTVSPALASGDGGGYWLPGQPTTIDIDAQNCRTRTWTNEAGKTPNGSHAVATDGCNRYEFTSTIGVGPASGEVTFKTSSASMGLEADKPLADVPNHCAFAAVAQANMAFVNYFGVPDGTEVRVKYACE
jgi:hypothetical protein